MTEISRPRTTPDDRGDSSLLASERLMGGYVSAQPGVLRYSDWAIGRQIIGKCQCVDCYREYCRGKS